jgi:TonB family protein
MKIFSAWLLLALLLPLSINAADAVPAKKDAPDPKLELSWPEIKDPQVLIDFAKTEIAKLKASGNTREYLNEEKIPEISYLHPWGCEVYPDYVLIGVITSKRDTWQALMITPNPQGYVLTAKDARHHISDTDIPEIKRCLLYIPPDLSGEMRQLEATSIRWKDFRNIDRELSTWPAPVFLVPPAYPKDLLRQGVTGEAKVEITISAEGEVVDIIVSTRLLELEAAVQEVARLWHFEPGINRETHLPMQSRVSVVIAFNIDD